MGFLWLLFFPPRNFNEEFGGNFKGSYVVFLAIAIGEHENIAVQIFKLPLHEGLQTLPCGSHVARGYHSFLQTQLRERARSAVPAGRRKRFGSQGRPGTKSGTTNTPKSGGGSGFGRQESQPRGYNVAAWGRPPDTSLHQLWVWQEQVQLNQAKSLLLFIF